MKIPHIDDLHREYTPEDIIDHMVAHGYESTPENVLFDGTIHRFGTRKQCWYVGWCEGDYLGAVYNDWSAGTDNITWFPGAALASDPRAHEWLAAKREAAKLARDEAHAVAATRASSVWAAAKPAKDDHPYLARKGIAPHGARSRGDVIILPVHDESGNIISLQYITADGTKRHMRGGRVAGGFWWVGDPGDSVYLAEGWATACSVHQATGKRCYVAYSAGNLLSIAKLLVDRGKHVTIIADNDLSGVGQAKATEAANATGCKVITIPIAGQDANDYVRTGGDLAGLLANGDKPASKPWIDRFSNALIHRVDRKWVIKRVLPAHGLAMLYGPSGVGKSFICMDIAMRVAAGGAVWNGYKVYPGTVAYLAGEGYDNLLTRGKAWLQVNQPSCGYDPDLYISSCGAELDTTAGLAHVTMWLDTIQAPKLIIIDTLHRFLAGDEDKAKDVHTMTVACAKLQDRYNATVLLVHHSGHSNKSRARGSSSWRGDLDVEWGIDDDGVLTQTKSKTDLPVSPVRYSLQRVTVEGEYDDGDPVTSAIVRYGDTPADEDSHQNAHNAPGSIGATPPIPTPTQGAKSSLYTSTARVIAAWYDSGQPRVNGQPYLSRDALRDHLVACGLSPATVNNNLSPGGKTLRPLRDAGKLQDHEQGWLLDPDILYQK